MKITLSIQILSIILPFAAIVSSDCGDQCRNNAIPLFRAYNPTSPDHFYTTNQAEWLTAPDYVPEAITGYIFPNQQPHTVPFYRSYHPSLSDHFYTANQGELNNALNNNGYKYEGIVGYVYPESFNGTSLPCGAAPLYRLYSDTAVDHFYTMSTAERDSVVGTYTIEGIAAYILP